MRGSTEDEPLAAPLDVGFDYTRSLGPVLGRFINGLKQAKIEGIRGSDGTVHVPPVEYDPETSQPLSEFVPVSDEGTVLSWSWMREPVAGQPVQRPFAWALIRLDGADTGMLHAVDVGAPSRIHTGMRVRVRWADEPIGHIRDIAYFTPANVKAESSPPPMTPQPPVANKGNIDHVSTIITPVHLRYQHSASREESRHLRGLAEGKLIGQRCPSCTKVYLPPRGSCPTDGVPTTDEIELPDTGIVTTFCIVNVPFLGQRIEPPYVAAYILIDGADIAFLHLVLGCPAEQVRMGMRVRASWKPRDQWWTSLENIDHFEPTGEPDAAFESFAHHL